MPRPSFGWSATILVLMALAFTAADAALFAFIGLAGFAIHLGTQAVLLDVDDPRRCLRLFRSNREAGAILFAGLALECFVRSF
jgi:4-hydroxybenzoate polyprenyltransferase